MDNFTFYPMYYKIGIKYIFIKKLENGPSISSSYVNILLWAQSVYQNYKLKLASLDQIKIYSD